MEHTSEVRLDPHARMGSDDPLCDVCMGQGKHIPANLVLQVAEKDSRSAEWFRVCQKHRKEGLLVCLTTSLRNPRISYIDLGKEDGGWVLFEHMDALRLIATF